MNAEGRQTPGELRAGRRALDGLDRVRILEDWTWDAERSMWVLRVSLATEVIADSTVLASTNWFIVVDPDYPWGSITFYPDKDGGISETYPHQMHNAEGEASRRWRDGNMLD